MTTIDIIILIIIGAGVVAGFMKGFIRQRFYSGIGRRFAGSKGFVCNVGGEALSGCDRLDDGCTGIGFYCHLDRCSADIHVSGVLADESDGSYFTGVAEPLAGEWIGSTQISVVNEPCDLCDRVYR